jgi:hypothetical protein
MEIIRELEGIGDRCCLARYAGKWWRVSTIETVFYNGTIGTQTLVFPCDEEGVATEWTVVAGGTGMNRGEAIADLMSRLYSSVPRALRQGMG